MEQITIGQIAITITLIAGLISGTGIILASVRKFIDKSFHEHLRPIDAKIDKLSEKIEETDQEACKDFIVARFSEVKHGEALDDISKERLHERFSQYVNHGGNSYIKTEFERYQKEGKL